VLLHLKNDWKFATASLAIAHSSIKFFYSHTGPRDWSMLKKLWGRRDKKLPDVVLVEEVWCLIDAVHTYHKRTYFWTVHSLGL
jgi:hypothetical protein